MKFVLAAALALVATPASAVSVYVAGTNPSAAGETNNIFPFGMQGDATSVRYQQLYDASLFGKSPVTIVGIAFRQDEVFGRPISYTTSRLSFGLSTVSSMASSTDLRSNLGKDYQLVVSGRMQLKSAYQGAEDATKAAPFDLALTFDDPFTYDPRKGSLLLDIVNRDPNLYIPLDAIIGSGVSRMVSQFTPGVDPQNFQDANYGVATRFDLAADAAETAPSLPEPASWALMIVGFGVAGGAFRRRATGRPVRV